MRVAPPKVFGVAAHASRPPQDAAGALDAYRQTSFVLGADVDLVVSGMNIEGAIADASTGATYRTQLTAATLGLWSRAWLARLGALHSLEWGNYVAALALIRSAADAQAGCLYLLKSAGADWDAWLAEGGVALAVDAHAMEFRLQAFRAAEVLAAHPVLGRVYRAATDLSLPHFAATLFVAGSESDGERIAMTFGDRDFHLGLAELTLGWLLELSATAIEDAYAYPEVFGGVDAAASATFSTQAGAAVALANRCRLVPVERDSSQRYLVEGWRRTPGSASKRLLL